MGPLILAWAVGEGIIVWRAAARQHTPPVPGQMLAATGLFAALALLAEYQPARAASIAFAYGVDLAILLKVLPGMKDTNTSKKAKPKPKPKGTATAQTSTAGVNA